MSIQIIYKFSHKVVVNLAITGLMCSSYFLMLTNVSLAKIQDTKADIHSTAIYAINSMDKLDKEILHLQEALKSSDQDVRISAIRRLEIIGSKAKAAVPSLINLLKDSDDLVVFNVIQALAQMNAVPELTRAIQSPDARVRIGAIAALGYSGKNAQSSLPQIASALKDSDQDVRKNAAAALGSIGVPVKGAVPDLIAMLKEPSEITRTIAAQTLSKMNEVPMLISALQSTESDENTRVGVAYALGKIGQPALPSLRVALRNSNPKVRSNAVEAIGNMFEIAANTPELLDLLKDADVQVRAQAAHTAGTTRSDTAIPRLILLLSDKNVEVRRQAAGAFMWFQSTKYSGVEKAIPELTRALKDSDAEVRENTLQSFNGIKVTANYGLIALPIVASMLQDQNQLNRMKAVTALYNLSRNSSNAVPFLINAFKNPDDLVRTTAADALGSMGTYASKAIPSLTEALADPNKNNRYAISLALVHLSKQVPSVIPELNKALKNPNQNIRQGAALTLGEIGFPANTAIAQLIATLKDTDRDTRNTSAYALLKIFYSYRVQSKNLSRAQLSKVISQMEQALTVLNTQTQAQFPKEMFSGINKSLQALKLKQRK